MLARMTRLGVLVVGMTLTACGDDERPTAPSSPTVAGLWEISEIARTARAEEGGLIQFLLAQATYVEVTDDDEFHVLLEQGVGFRYQYSGLYAIAQNQVTFESERFTFTRDGDTLVLSRPEVSYTLVVATDGSSHDEWIVPMQVDLSLEAPHDKRADLAWNGTYLWVSNYDSSNPLTAILPATGERLDVSTTRDATTLTFRGDELWSNDRGRDNLYRLGPDDGTTVFTSDPIGDRVEAIASEGGVVWCVADDEGTLRAYNPALDASIATIDLGAEQLDATGATMADGMLYLVVRGVVHECAVNHLPPSFEILRAYDLPGTYVTGIAHDGENFWVYAMNSVTGETSIRRVTF